MIGRKKLPWLAKNHRKIWARIETVDNSGEALLRELQEMRYITKADGEQILPTFEASKEGKYEITFYNDHTHLSYKLTESHQRKTTTSIFHIKPKANYLVFVKNTANGHNSNHQPPAFSTFLKEKFDNNTLIPLNPIDFINYPDTELLIISSREQHKTKR